MISCSSGFKSCCISKGICHPFHLSTAQVAHRSTLPTASICTGSCYEVENFSGRKIPAYTFLPWVTEPTGWRKGKSSSLAEDFPTLHTIVRCCLALLHIKSLEGLRRPPRRNIFASITPSRFAQNNCIMRENCDIMYCIQRPIVVLSK